MNPAIDPRLQEVSSALGDTGLAAVVCDPGWHIVWLSDELKKLLGEDDEGKLGYGTHISQAWGTDLWNQAVSDESRIEAALHNFPYIAWDTEGGAEQLVRWFKDRKAIPEEVEFPIEAKRPGTLIVNAFDFLQGDLPPFRVNQFFVRLNDPEGNYFGNAIIYNPNLPASITSLVVRGDIGMFERMTRLFEPGRRAAAVLFADLESSATLARRLSSAAYFELIRSFTTTIDEVVVRHQGVVGKHAGDGVTAFFLGADCGSPSAAARAAIQAARDMDRAAQQALDEVELRAGPMEGVEVKVNAGAHWGPNLYMGQLVTGGRLEVTALGDEVNECARILQSARGGEALASKVLIEQLDPGDAAALELDPDVLRYHQVGELPGVTEKAVRDAGGIPVTSIL